MEKKISIPEIIIMLMILVSAYLFGVFGDLSGPLPGIGQVILFFSEAYDVVVMAITQLWLIMKGGIMASRQLTLLGGNLAQMIPGLNLLPVNIAAFIIAVYLINNPKVEEIAGVATGKMTK